MTVDQSLTSVAPDRAEMSFGFELLSAEEINEALGGEPDDYPETVPGSIMASSPTPPAWPRVYPGI